MSLVTFFAVFGAALLYATWNTLLKSGDDKVLSMAGIVVGHIPFGIVALFFVSLPSINCLPYLGASIVFHTGYQFFLLKSYQIGDLTHVYPLARVAETSWGFYSCLTICNGIVAICYLLLTKPKILTDLAIKGRKIFVIGGGTSFLAYGIVTWAFTQAPIALVTALRETSIIIALLMGVFF